jgi:hypothetical protein
MFQVLLVISSTSWGLRWWFDAHGAAKDALFLTVFILTGHGLAVRDMVSAVVGKYHLPLPPVSGLQYSYISSQTDGNTCIAAG